MGNGILPVEIFHRKWDFTNGNFPCLTVHFNGNNVTLLLNVIFQWKFSMGNGILPVENFHGKHGLYLVSENLGIS